MRWQKWKIKTFKTTENRVFWHEKSSLVDCRICFSITLYVHHCEWFVVFLSVQWENTSQPHADIFHHRNDTQTTDEMKCNQHSLNIFFIRMLVAQLCVSLRLHETSDNARTVSWEEEISKQTRRESWLKSRRFYSSSNRMQFSIASRTKNSSRDFRDTIMTRCCVFFWPFPLSPGHKHEYFLANAPGNDKTNEKKHENCHRNKERIVFFRWTSEVVNRIVKFWRMFN